MFNFRNLSIGIFFFGSSLLAGAEVISLEPGQSIQLSPSRNVIVACGPQAPLSACAQAADVSSREFYVCAQFHGAEFCFHEQILAKRPQPSCPEWGRACSLTCEASGLPVPKCMQFCAAER